MTEKKLKKNYHEKTGEIYISVLFLREVDLEFERERIYQRRRNENFFPRLFENIV